MFFKSREPHFILGKGSNVLLNPQFKARTVVKISETIVPVERRGNTLVVPAGMTVHMLMKILVEEGLSCLEFSAGVPASLGGMVAMNFGCWGQEIAEFVDSVWIVDDAGRSQWVSVEEMGFSYRMSQVQKCGWAVLAVRLKIHPDDKDQVRTRIQTMIRTRIEKQPLKEKTFGSIFKNGDSYKAGQVIEEVGLKGYSFGHVQLASSHANFLVNTGEASFEDAFSAIQKIQKTVYDKKHIALEPEVKLIS